MLIRFLKTVRVGILAGVAMCTLYFFMPQCVFAYGSGGTSGAAFLEIGTGARALSMGESSTAASEDVNALYYNPSGLGTLQYPVASIVHEELLFDSRFENITAALPYKKGYFGFSSSVFWVPPFEKTDINGNAQGKVQFLNSSYTLGYGRQLGPVYLGGSLKYIYQRIDTLNVSSAAVDIGILKQMYLYSPFAAPVRNFNVGFSLLNLGTNAKQDPLPRSVRFGAAYMPVKWMKIQADLSESMINSSDLYDFTYGFDESFRLNTGFELAWQDMLFLRGGYRFNDAGTYTFGFGFNYAIENVSFIIDSSYADNGIFGPAYAINVTFKLIPKVVTSYDKKNAEKYYQDGIRFYVADDLDSAITAFRASRDFNPYQKNINEKISDLEELSDLKAKNKKYDEMEQNP